MCGVKLGATQRERRAAQAAWELEHAADDLRPEVFQQSIFRCCSQCLCRR